MTFHYTSGASNQADIAQAGFDIADVSYVSGLDALPAGMKGLVYLGERGGATTTFRDKVDKFVSNSVVHPKLFGFYLCDEPHPSNTTAAQLKAMADYIHANVPGAQVFVALQNMGSNTEPNFAPYTPENTNIDLFGVGYYPCNTVSAPVYDRIDKMVAAAVAAGIPVSKIVPEYQTFGGGDWTAGDGGRFRVPTPDELKAQLDRWRVVCPNPVFDYAYKWGTQNNDTGLESLPELQAVCLEYNKMEPSEPAPTPANPLAVKLRQYADAIDAGTLKPSSVILHPGDGSVISIATGGTP